MNNKRSRSKLPPAVKQNLIAALEQRQLLQTKELARKYDVPEYLINRLSMQLRAERQLRKRNDGAGRQLQLF